MSLDENLSNPAISSPRALQYRALWPLWTGMLVLALLWLSPLPAMSRDVFHLHMLLHLGVVVIASPLLGVGLKRVGFGVWVSSHMLFWALAASLFEMLVVWSWHIPALHEAASRQTLVFALQQLTFLAAGVLIWLVSFSGGSRAAAGMGAVALMMTFMHMTMLGVLLALVPDLLYPADLYQGSNLEEKLWDQSFGGVLMAIGGSFPYLVGGLVLAYRLITD